MDRYQKSPPMLVEPAYCVEEGVWFLDDGTTAKSLSELQTKLPHAVIEGYYPRGFNPERPKRTTGMFSNEFRMSQMRAPSYPRTSRAVVLSETVPEEEPEPVIEATFLEPRKAPEPVKEAEPPRVKMYKPARQRQVSQSPKPERLRTVKNDSTSRRSAEEAGKYPNRRWDDELDLELKTLVKQGWSAAEISVEMGFTRNAIAGRCYRKGFKLHGVRSSQKEK